MHILARAYGVQAVGARVVDCWQCRSGHYSDLLGPSGGHFDCKGGAKLKEVSKCHLRLWAGNTFPNPNCGTVFNLSAYFLFD